MFCFIVIYLLVVLVVVFLDLTPMLLDESTEKLLYTDQCDTVKQAAEQSEMEASPFGTSTLDGNVASESMVDEEAKKKAEELLDEIYNSQ